MTRIVLRWLRTLATLGLAWPLTGLSSPQSFTLVVPAANPAIARVKFTLAGAGAGMLTASGTNPDISGTFSFSVAGATSFGAGAIASDTAGDLMRVDSVGGDLVVQYIRNGHFATGPNFCSPNPSAQTASDTITFTLNGVSSSGFRTNSYTVPGSPGVTAVDCSKAKRRVAAGAVWSTLPPGTNLGRHPLDVILVLDKSGSMGTQDIPIGATASFETRLQALQDTAGEFVGEFTAADPHNTEGADRLALVFYDSSPSPASLTSANFVRRDSAATPWGTIATTISTTTAGGSTAMGPGIQAALDGWRAPGVANPDFDDASIVLLTDGLQNTGALVTQCSGTQNYALNPGCGASTTCSPAGSAELYLCGVPMETLALGPAADHMLIDGISQQTAGISKLALSNDDLSKGFGDSLVNLLAGNSESILFRTENTFTPSTVSPIQPILLDGSVNRAIFVLGWQGPRTQGALDLAIFKPGCTPQNCDPTPPVMRSDGAFYTIQSVDIPASGPIGTWSVAVVRRGAIGREAAVGGGQVPYHLAGYSIDGRLSYRINLAGIGQGTGDTLNLQAQLSYDGKPLPGLASAITVHVDRPPDAEGTYLHNTSVPDGVLTTEPNPGDTTGPFERKLLYLSANGNLRSILQPQPLPTTYTLLDNGNSHNGDFTANDGVYSGQIADTSRPGLYRFTITMDWNNPTTGQIHRVANVEREVKVNATPDASQVTVTKGSTPGDWLIGVTPMDRFGNYTGPGFGDAVDVQVTGGGALSGGTEDAQQTGAYVLKLTGVPAGTDPTVVVKVQGKEIRNGKLSTIGKGHGCSGIHLATALPTLPLGMLLLGAIVYFPRKKKE